MKSNNRFFLIALGIMSLMACQNTSTPPLSTSYEVSKIETIKKESTISEIDTTPIIVKQLTPQEVPNLWRRIQMQFSLPLMDNKEVTQQLNWYKKHPTYIKRMSDRASPYLYYIVQELEKRQMPLEIALLPIVESAFDPFAYSHGSASGMWQIISDTGKRFGLEQNWWYDGRRDIAASTTAALDYLTFLHKRFDGNWIHALAAYNSGEGRVGRSIKRNKKLGKKTDFSSLKLPKETKSYVPKLLALAILLNKPEKYGIHWPTLPNKAIIGQVNINSQIDLALLAKLAEITLKDLNKLNPGFNYWATPPSGQYSLLLPIEKIETFKIALAKVPSKDRLKWTRYKIKSGDNLGIIAQNHKTTINIIRQVNNISGSSIRAGKYLLIPIASTHLSNYQLPQRSSPKSKKNQQSKLVKEIYVVKSGDNLWDIAKKYKINYKSIAKWNNLTLTKPLKLNKKLVIWLNHEAIKTNTTNQFLKKITYSVKKGDSLALIAQKFNVKLKDVVRWNSLNIKKYLKIGQRLKLKVNITDMNN